MWDGGKGGEKRSLKIVLKRTILDKSKSILKIHIVPSVKFIGTLGIENVEISVFRMELTGKKFQRFQSL